MFIKVRLLRQGETLSVFFVQSDAKMPLRDEIIATAESLNVLRFCLPLEDVVAECRRIGASDTDWNNQRAFLVNLAGPDADGDARAS